ncbi:TPA: TolC family outer membrane protein [Escherichia coli]|nr:TolC family outer membrane protein [Escherichia coli]HAL2299324.1 TolC family outer membrane protein [Escherichia coli]HAL2620537.1 TolC family outer membrane protein [Escherichia coli]HDY0565204.1 TolC family outer membrane protein [Escherichia coli]
MARFQFKSRKNNGFIFLISFMVMGEATIAAPLPQWANAPAVTPVARLSLQESILRAFARNPDVTQQAAQIGIGEAQIDEAKSAWYPHVGLTGNAGPSRQTDSSGRLDNNVSYGITLTQLVYDFGKTNNDINLQTAARDSYRFKLMATLTDVAEKTATAYMEVSRYQALCDAAQRNIHSLENVYNMAALRANAGLNSSSDELQAQTRIAGMRSTLEQYQAQMASAKAQLAVLTGVQPEAIAAPPAELAEQPVSLKKIDYQSIPLVLAAENLRQSAQYGVEKTKAQYWPTLSIQGGKTRYQTSDRSYWDDQLQLNVNAPLYQGGAVSAQVQQAEGQQKISASQVEQAKLDVLQRASVAYANWTGARGREEAGLAQSESAHKTRDVYQNEYKLGKRSLNDLLTVEQDVFQAQSAEINANYDGWVAAVNYAAAVNNLIPLAGIKQGLYNDLPDLK